MDKIKAARQAEGVIDLEEASAGRVKAAIEAVSRIVDIEGDQLKFEGERIVAGHGFGERIACYDIYQCPNGFLLHTYVNGNPNWATGGQSLSQMLAAAPDVSVARRAHGELVKHGFLSIHNHPW